MKKSILLIYILLLASCSSLYRFTIEVQEPAPVTLPPDIANILVVNNSVPQPSDAGIYRMYRGKPVEGIALNLDSMASVATLSLASQLQKSRFFGQVLTSPVSLRSDDEWMSKKPLPDSFKTETFDVQGFDGIISIDRLLFLFEQKMVNDYYSSFRLTGSIACSIYIYSRNNPLSSFTISDSLSYSTPVLGDSIEVFKKLPESIIEYLFSGMGEHLSRMIIPGWSEKSRYLYAGSQARMQEALRFAQKNKWSHAINLWNDEYELAFQPNDKGRLASNLAVAYEMLDQFNTALQWANSAKNYFRETGKTDTSPENARIDAYIIDLQKRIKDNYLLDIQWGISEDSSWNLE